MPIPLGGAVSLAYKGRKTRMCPESTYDPELEEFRKLEKYIQRNIKCTIELSKGIIPQEKGKIDGIITLEAKKDVKYCGILIFMKGLPLSEKKKKSRHHAGIQSLTQVKFTVLESTFTEGVRDTIKIDGGSAETYPVELEIPEELPPPLLSSTGKLIYRMHVCVATSNKRIVRVGETSLVWQINKKLNIVDIKKELKIEQQVQSKRGMLGLGRRRSAMLEWKIRNGGYLPGERIHVELWGKCKEKDGLQVESKVELVQKVWYQIPSGVQIGKMYSTMKVNVLSREACGGKEGEMIEILKSEEEGDDSQKRMLWCGKLRIPKGITPTVEFDFLNGVNYTIRASAGVTGEIKEGWVSGEAAVLIGTTKEVLADNDDDSLDGKSDEDEEAVVDFDLVSLPQTCPPSPTDDEKGFFRSRRGSAGAVAAANTRRSYSLSFIPGWARSRQESLTSMGSLASSTLSIVSVPPSYSDLSRTTTLENLPPAYCEIELEGLVASLTVGRRRHPQTVEEDTTNPEDTVITGKEANTKDNSENN